MKRILDYEGEVRLAWTKQGYGEVSFNDDPDLIYTTLGEILDDWLDWTPKHYHGEGRLHIMVEVEETDAKATPEGAANA